MCADAGAPPAGSSVVLTADIDGEGCASYAVWSDGLLTVPARGARPEAAYQLGVATDQAVLGDWDCDGRATPGVYRPDSGEAFVFDGWASAGHEVPARPIGLSFGRPNGPDGVDRPSGSSGSSGSGSSGAANGTVRVGHSTEPAPRGCDRLEVIVR